MPEPQVRYSLYILRCADGSLYTGIALDVGKRLQEHALGPRGAKYLHGRGPLTLEFQEMIGDRRAASQAEYLVKNLPKSDKERLISGATSLVELGADNSLSQVSGNAGG
jgi:putative endonuclease